MVDVVVRERVPADVPGLVEVLVAQRPHSLYPQNWPLSYPLEQFISRPTEDGAWVAELDGRLVGHVAVTRVPETGVEVPAWCAATGRPVDELAAVAVLFVHHEAKGAGVGTALLTRAVQAIRDSGRAPVLDVVQETVPAVELYRRRGWQVVGEARPPWLPADHLPVLLMVLPDDVSPS